MTDQTLSLESLIGLEFSHYRIIQEQSLSTQSCTDR